MREDAAAASPLVPVIEALLGRHDGPGEQGFDITATELLDRLRKICAETVQRARWFPNTAAAVGAQLRRIAPLLAERGIIIEAYRIAHGMRRIKLRCRDSAVFASLAGRFRTNREEDGGKP